MRTITLPRHYWLGFRLRAPIREREEVAKPIAADDTKPRAPVLTEERFWAVSGVKVCGIPLPNRFQAIFFAGLCILLALPVFLFDKSGQAIRHGFITFGGIAVFAGFCWTIGMILAAVSEDPKDRSRKG